MFSAVRCCRPGDNLLFLSTLYMFGLSTGLQTGRKLVVSLYIIFVWVDHRVVDRAKTCCFPLHYICLGCPPGCRPGENLLFPSTLYMFGLSTGLQTGRKPVVSLYIIFVWVVHRVVDLANTCCFPLHYICLGCPPGCRPGESLLFSSTLYLFGLSTGLQTGRKPVVSLYIIYVWVVHRVIDRATTCCFPLHYICLGCPPGCRPGDNLLFPSTLYLFWLSTGLQIGRQPVVSFYIIFVWVVHRVVDLATTCCFPLHYICFGCPPGCRSGDNLLFPSTLYLFGLSTGLQTGRTPVVSLYIIYVWVVHRVVDLATTCSFPSTLYMFGLFTGLQTGRTPVVSLYIIYVWVVHRVVDRATTCCFPLHYICLGCPSGCRPGDNLLFPSTLYMFGLSTGLQTGRKPVVFHYIIFVWVVHRVVDRAKTYCFSLHYICLSCPPGCRPGDNLLFPSTLYLFWLSTGLQIGRQPVVSLYIIFVWVVHRVVDRANTCCFPLHYICLGCSPGCRPGDNLLFPSTLYLFWLSTGLQIGRQPVVSLYIIGCPPGCRPGEHLLFPSTLYMFGLSTGLQTWRQPVVSLYIIYVWVVHRVVDRATHLLFPSTLYMFGLSTGLQTGRTPVVSLYIIYVWVVHRVVDLATTCCFPLHYICLGCPPGCRPGETCCFPLHYICLGCPPGCRPGETCCFPLHYICLGCPPGCRPGENLLFPSTLYLFGLSTGLQTGRKPVVSLYIIFVWVVHRVVDRATTCCFPLHYICLGCPPGCRPGRKPVVFLYIIFVWVVHRVVDRAKPVVSLYIIFVWVVHRVVDQVTTCCFPLHYICLGCPPGCRLGESLLFPSTLYMFGLSTGLQTWRKPVVSLYIIFVGVVHRVVDRAKTCCFPLHYICWGCPPGCRPGENLLFPSTLYLLGLSTGLQTR